MWQVSKRVSALRFSAMLGCLLLSATVWTTGSSPKIQSIPVSAISGSQPSFCTAKSADLSKAELVGRGSRLTAWQSLEMMRTQSLRQSRRHYRPLTSLWLSTPRRIMFSTEGRGSSRTRIRQCSKQFSISRFGSPNSSVAFPAGNYTACPAKPAAVWPAGASVEVGVFGSVFVSARAMRLGLISGRGDFYQSAPSDIFGVSDRLQMLGINTASYPTQMIQFQSIGNGTDVKFVGERMRTASPAIRFHLSITSRVNRADPQPTSAFGDRYCLLGESFLDGEISFWHSISLSVQNNEGAI